MYMFSYLLYTENHWKELYYNSTIYHTTFRYFMYLVYLYMIQCPLRVNSSNANDSIGIRATYHLSLEANLQRGIQFSPFRAKGAPRGEGALFHVDHNSLERREGPPFICKHNSKEPLLPFPFLWWFSEYPLCYACVQQSAITTNSGVQNAMTENGQFNHWLAKLLFTKLIAFI